MDEKGQGTVEAAFTIPVLFVLMLLLIQPGIILYDRTVMKAAASEACRLLATKTDGMDGACEAFIRHRLAAIPPHSCFHVHEGGCSWVIEMTGGQESGQVSVRIENQVRPLPLFDAACALAGVTNGSGNLTVSVECSAPTQPAWVDGAPAGRNPAAWPGAWAEGDDADEG